MVSALLNVSDGQMVILNVSDGDIECVRWWY